MYLSTSKPVSQLNPVYPSKHWHSYLLTPPSEQFPWKQGEFLQSSISVTKFFILIPSITMLLLFIHLLLVMFYSCKCANYWVYWEKRSLRSQMFWIVGTFHVNNALFENTNNSFIFKKKSQMFYVREISHEMWISKIKEKWTQNNFRESSDLDLRV